MIAQLLRTVFTDYKVHSLLLAIPSHLVYYYRAGYLSSSSSSADVALESYFRKEQAGLQLNGIQDGSR